MESSSEPQNLISDLLTKLGKSEKLDNVLGSYRTVIKSNTVFGLDLMGLGIEEIPNNIFDNISELTHLYLSWNRISFLPSGIFDNLANLVHLDLRGSGIQEVSEGLFDELVYLERLELNDNNLEVIPDSLFKHLRGLKEINLSNNKISVLPGKLFQPLIHLERLYLYFNPIPEDIAMGDYYDRETVEEAIEKLIKVFNQ